MWLFKKSKICAKCGKKSWNVTKRSYLTKADPKPISTPNDICNKCHNKMVEFLKANNLTQ